ncbi:MAG TPA: HAD family hydrolase [Pyrinomonadaceae bacterium]|jgi:D-glycero-D-manno-heptose 1,7-bisphosphate phosphatase
MKTENQKSKIKNQKSPAVFIDRDGTLIKEVNFLSRVEDLRFFSFTAEAIELLKEKGFLIIVVTNQSGIARKIFAESAMHEIHEKIQEELTGKLDQFYFCPHLPTDGCDCRKPNVGMIETACANFAIDLENSWIIGDKAIDIETGFNAKIKTALVLTGYGQKALETLERKPDVVAENLLEAVKTITKD